MEKGQQSKAEQSKGKQNIARVCWREGREGRKGEEGGKKRERGGMELQVTKLQSCKVTKLQVTKLKGGRGGRRRTSAHHSVLSEMSESNERLCVGFINERN